MLNFIFLLLPDLDMPTVLASQLTYEGLIAESFGIKTGFLKKISVFYDLW